MASQLCGSSGSLVSFGKDCMLNFVVGNLYTEPWMEVLYGIVARAHVFVLNIPPPLCIEFAIFGGVYYIIGI